MGKVHDAVHTTAKKQDAVTSHCTDPSSPVWGTSWQNIVRANDAPTNTNKAMDGRTISSILRAQMM
jgi:hypothetical protein